ncbi:metallo-beta-lactamase domain protein [Whalleya microplaca]|nr:metallo-beta-lactamase domain protein [Whalleya microplaca]
MALRIPFDESFWKDYLSGQEAKLPILPEIDNVTDRVIRILGDNPGSMQLQGTNTYIIGTGRSRILIDTAQGMPAWINRIGKVLDKRNLELTYILVTHWHGDHTGGIPDLISYNQRYASRVYKAQPDPGQKPIIDGQTFHVEGATVRAVFTPGHAVDHMSFVLEEEQAMLTGDNVLGHGFSVVQDLGAYMRSLDRMVAEECRTGYPAHGAKILDLPLKMREYIRHKEFRIQQVYTALLRSSRERHGNETGTGLTIYEIVHAIYGTVPADLAEKAMEPLLTQVLWKLAEDKKVGFQMANRKKRWFATSHKAGDEVLAVT